MIYPEDHKNRIKDLYIECIIEDREQECEHCHEKSIFVRAFNTSYRNCLCSEPSYSKLCIDCYYYCIVFPMDDQWNEYYSTRF